MARTKEIAVGEGIGVAMAIVSSCLGGTAAAVTMDTFYRAADGPPQTLTSTIGAGRLRRD